MPVGAIGAVVGVGGAALSAKQQRKSSNAAARAAEFRPYDVDLGQFGGEVDFNRKAETARFKPTDFQNQLMSLLQPQTLQNLQGNPMLDAANQLITAQGAGAAGQLGPAFDQLQASAGSLPAFTQTPGLYNQNLFGNLGLQQALTGNVMPNIAAQGAVNPALLQAGSMNALSNFGDFQGNLNNTINDRLSLLREQARPAQNRATMSALNRLQATGNVGSTAGAEQLRGLSEAQAQEDLGFQLAAGDFGLRESAQLENQLVNRTNLGLNQLGTAFGQTNANVGNLFNIMNQGVNLEGALSDRGVQFSNLGNQRAAQRFANAQNFFNFARGIDTDALNRAITTNDMLRNVNTDARNLIALGGNLGGAAAEAGANVGRAYLANSESQYGSLLSSIGGGLMGGAF